MPNTVIELIILEAFSYCANISSSIQTNFSVIGQRLEKEIQEKVKQKKPWILQENYGPFVYLSLWTGGVRTGLSTLRLGFHAGKLSFRNSYVSHSTMALRVYNIGRD